MMHNGELKSPEMMPAHQTSGPLPVEPAMGMNQGSMDSVNGPSEDEVRTLFVSGLPMDAKPRELYLLFRAYKGYENALLKIMASAHKNNNGYENALLKMMGSQFGKINAGYEGSLLKVTNKNGKNTSPVGFVTFSSRVAAEAAKQDLQGVRFDPDLPQTLRLEFAKSNTKVTKPKQQSPQPATAHPTLIHPITGQDLGAAFFQGPGPEAWAPPHPLAYPELAPSAAALHHHTALMQHPALAQLPVRALGDNLAWPVGSALGYEATLGDNLAWPCGSALGYEFHPAMMGAQVTATLPHPSMASTPIMASPVGGLSAITHNGSASSPVPGMSQHSPCSTLFVANLGQFSSEQELKDLFSSFQGFSRLKMYNKNGSPVAFVEYQDVRQAQEALNRLQGFVLLSSDRGGIRIEYAKNKMGEVTTREEMMFQSPIAITAS